MRRQRKLVKCSELATFFPVTKSSRDFLKRAPNNNPLTSPTFVNPHKRSKYLSDLNTLTLDDDDEEEEENVEKEKDEEMNLLKSQHCYNHHHLQQQLTHNWRSSIELSAATATTTPTAVDFHSCQQENCSVYTMDYIKLIESSTIIFPSSTPVDLSNFLTSSLSPSSSSDQDIADDFQEELNKENLSSPNFLLHTETLSSCSSSNYHHHHPHHSRNRPTLHRSQSLFSPSLRQPVEYCHNACGLPRISSLTLLQMLQCESPQRFCIVDCRYPYEYASGHIRHAVNLYTHDLIRQFIFDRRADDTFKCEDETNFDYQQQQQQLNLEEKMFDSNHLSTTPLSSPTSIVTRHSAAVLQHRRHRNAFTFIFHCEFSSNRGPNLARYLRELDRNANLMNYPHLDFPELYILDGGYKEFYGIVKTNVAKGRVNEEVASRWFCPTMAYVEMHNKDANEQKAMFSRIAKLSRVKASQRERRMCLNSSPSS